METETPRALPLSGAVRWSGLGVLALATVAGLWAIAETLGNGHGATATTQHVPWGLWVALYIFFLGLSSGSFLLSALAYVFHVKRLEAAGPYALTQAFACLILGGALIIIDLGHPARIFKVLTAFNPTSVMAFMGIFYAVYVVILLAAMYFALRARFIAEASRGGIRGVVCRLLSLRSRTVDAASLARDARWLRRLGIVGIPVAIFMTAGVGTIFAVAKARPGWFGGVFPIIFLISALASGAGMLTVVIATFSRRSPEKKRRLVRDLARLTIIILAVDVLFFASEVLTTLYGGIPREAEGWLITLTGPFWYTFWIVQLAIGIVIPTFLVALKRTRDSVRWLGVAGLLVVIGMIGARLTLVIPAQIPLTVPMDLVYHHPRYAAGYFPSAQEWLVGLGIFAIGIWFLLAAVRYLPLERSTEAKTSPPEKQEAVA